MKPPTLTVLQTLRVARAVRRGRLPGATPAMRARGRRAELVYQRVRGRLVEQTGTSSTAAHTISVCDTDPAVRGWAQAIARRGAARGPDA